MDRAKLIESAPVLPDERINPLGHIAVKTYRQLCFAVDELSAKLDIVLGQSEGTGGNANG